MINYTSINDAWGIKDEKETFKNIQKNDISLENDDKDMIEKMSNKINELNNEIKFLKNKNNSIEKMSNKIEDLNAEIEFLKNNNEKQNIEGFNNSSFNPFRNLIEGFEFKIKPNKHLIIYITLLFMVIISILFIHSFRKPIEFETAKKNLYIFPEDLSKLKELIDIAKN